MSRRVEALSKPAKPFVLQDRYRLPARFFAGLSGAWICRLGV